MHVYTSLEPRPLGTYSVYLLVDHPCQVDIFCDHSCKLCYTTSPSDFSAALSYTLSFVGKQDLLPKDKQVEMLGHLYDGSDVFLWVPTAMASASATRRYRSSSMPSLAGQVQGFSPRY